MDAGASADLGEFVRAWVNLWSCDAALGLGATRPSDSCLVCLAGCVGWGCCVAAFRFWDASVPETHLAGMRSCVEARSCWRRGRSGLSLHLLGNDGGQRRARGMGSRERSVVLKGATSSTRSVARGGDAAGGDV